MAMTMAELLERSKPGYVHTITQERLDSERPEDHRWLFPGVNGPGQYTWNEAAHTYEPVNPTLPTTQKQESQATTHDFDRGFGIGGLGRYVEDPIIPTARGIGRMERMEATDTICRRCGTSKNFDGAMFTTMAGDDICDDCFG